MERGGSCSWNLSYRRNFGERDGRVEGVDVKAGVCYTYKGGGYTNLEISDPREVHNKGHVQVLILGVVIDLRMMMDTYESSNLPLDGLA